ncbi:MAG TPA: FAD-dependent oxidoreductase [Allosphingosinicella sp.]|jgi:3-phenylpropionate/trans-cinnamate dioxygenase ferredoxin reductase subunit|nr:FAD-dependent oxidoreductase [Allosphingosinicella sp.]
MRHYDVAIVGTGHGGAQAAIQLRQAKFEGSIALIGRETELPYERPPLSKEYLVGEKEPERLLFRPKGFWAERGIEVLTGKEVVRVDAGARRLGCGDGEEIGFGKLVWAAGGVPKRLPVPGAELAHVIRSREDVDRIRALLPEVRRVAVIGGGYIGLETAAAMRKLGKEVVLFEALDRVLARVAGEPLSRFVEARHRAEGVDVRLRAKVEAIGEGWLRTPAGEEACDLVIAGIGIDAAAAPLLDAGAEGGNGVLVDAFCRTSLPDVWAVGDCALHESRWAGGARIRIESVQNAHDMAATAARDIAGVPQPYEAVPWFWSNQYDLRLQSVGLWLGYDEIVTRGEPESGSFSLVYLSAGKVIALDCVNAVRDYAQGRKLVERGARIAPKDLADTSRQLKELAG